VRPDEGDELWGAVGPDDSEVLGKVLGVAVGLSLAIVG